MIHTFFLVSVDVIVDSEQHTQEQRMSRSKNEKLLLWQYLKLFILMICVLQHEIHLKEADCVSSGLRVLSETRSKTNTIDKERWAVPRVHQHWHFLRIQHT